MKSKILMKFSTVAMLFLVGVGFIGNTASLSATSIESNIPNTINDLSLKYNLNEADFKDFSNLVNEELSNKQQVERGAVSTIKNALKLILKYADKLPSWISKPLKTLFQPLMNALDKYTTITLSALKNLMISVGFNHTVANFIIDIIDWFFL